MSPIQMTLRNYQGFRGEHVFKFPATPGLYFMRGQNDVEPRLGSNGAGKTTIWKALFWLIFGRTPDGLKAGDVCTWGMTKGTEVSLVYMAKNGEPRRLTRTWGPISWTLELCDTGEKIDLVKGQLDQLTADIGAGLDPFLHSVMLAQEGLPFLDLKGETQATLFSSVLDLNKWMEYSDRASKKASMLDRECRTLESQAAELRGQLSAQKDHTPQYEQFERERRKRIQDLTAKHDRLLKELDETEARRDKERKIDEEVTKVLADVSDAADKAAVAVQVHKAAVADSARKRDKIQLELDHAEKHMHMLSEHDDCPTCGRTMKGDQGIDVLRDLAKGISKLEKELVPWELDVQRGTNDVRHFESELERLKVAERTAREMAAETRSTLARYMTNVRAVERDLDAVEDDLDRARDEVNPYRDIQQRSQRETERLKQELSEAQVRLDELIARVSVCSYWVRGFKDVRLQMIESALDELEIEVNNSAAELGLVGWELRFGIDRETKGGTIQRGFSCHVLSPTNEKPVPWASWSGGEKGRLRNAGEMGLSNLIRNHMGVGLNLEVWDEPGRGLSPEGVKDLLDTLARRAELEQRQIWIVDHMSHAYGGFAGEALIIKGPKGSYIKQ